MKWILVIIFAAATCYGFQIFPNPQASIGIRSSEIMYQETARESVPTAGPKDFLLNLLEMTPRNAPTPRAMTHEILKAVRELESNCPTLDSDVKKELGGTWELLWTTQDQSAPESKRLGSFINPFENQSYSNNPEGRSNPFLPRPVQDRLEKLGLVSDSAVIQSTQVIDLKKRMATNVVAFGLGRARQKASVTVNVAFRPNGSDRRRLDVRFESCRIRLPGTPVNLNFPLGLAGPIGWLRTTYIDDNLRITRGHKGSVFVLKRPRRASV